MNDPQMHCGSFTIERSYAAAPERVFAAWSSASAKQRWFFGPPGWEQIERVLEFRPGGREVLKGRFPNRLVTHFDSRYHEIRENRLIVFAYDMYVNDTKLSVSLGAVQFPPASSGTLLVVTEHGVYFGTRADADNREHGTGGLLDNLAAAL